MNWSARLSPLKLPVAESRVMSFAGPGAAMLVALPASSPCWCWNSQLCSTLIAIMACSAYGVQALFLTGYSLRHYSPP